MLEENAPYSFYLCDWHLTVEWMRAAGDKAYQVNVMIHRPGTALHGRDLSIALLDSANSPLTLLNPAVDFSPLLSVFWGGQETQYKIARFGRGETEASLIQLDLRGHRASIPIATGKGGKSRAKKKDDGGTTSGKREGSGDGGKQDGGRRDDGRKAPPPPQCCVTQFNTPNGALPTTRVALAGGTMLQCQPWVITATFDNKAPCQCNCCEYRQFIKGTATATAPGAAPVDASPVTDYAPPPQGPVAPGAPPPAPVPIQGINAANWIEDSTGDPAKPGNPKRYGPRAQAADGTQDYPTPCTYWAFDMPHADVPTGVRFNVNWDFRGYIRDVCRNVDSAGPNNWNWTTNQVG